MNLVLYMYHQQFPTAPRMKRWLCSCGRTIFKASNENIVITNDTSLPYAQYEPGKHIIELQCHSCKAKYTIYFQ